MTYRKTPAIPWERLTEKIRNADEQQALEMLKEARAGGLDSYYLGRIYKRYSKLREARELRELLLERKEPWP